MEKYILDIANMFVRRDFIKYPEQEEIVDMASALTVIIMEAEEETNFGLEPAEVYDYLNTLFVTQEIEKPVDEVSSFRELDADETCEFKKWARENFQIGTPISALWHPVTREECEKMNYEADQRAENMWT